MKYFMIGIVIMVGFWALLFTIQGWTNGDGEGPIVVPEEVFPDDGRSYFLLRHRTHIHEPNLFFVRLKIEPPDNIPAKQGLVDIDILLRGVDVPLTPDDRDYRIIHFRRLKRHESRQEAAESFVWDILSNTEYAWVDNAEVSADGAALECDIYYMRGNVAVSLAEAMFEMGVARRKGDIPHDWGNP